MRCLLFVGLAIEIYKKPVMIRIYLDDKFIDEITLGKSNLKYLQKWKKKIKKNNYLDPTVIWTPPGGPDHMFVYEVDTPDANVTIKLMIDNDDNNFTNGFLTKFTSVTLLYLNLIPLKIFCNEKISRIKKYSFSRKSNFFNGKAKEIKNWYKSRPKFFGNLVYKRCPIKFIAKDNTVFNDIHLWSNGKSGTYLCEITKKFGIYVNKNKNKFLGYYHFWFDDIKNLFDKYLKYENQRDSN